MIFIVDFYFEILIFQTQEFIIKLKLLEKSLNQILQLKTKTKIKEAPKNIFFEILKVQFPFKMSSQSVSFIKTLSKYLPSSQSKKKFKRQCLKSKNILQENESVQIGCKIEKLYDFYTSKNFVQVNLFIGNKLSRPIEKYSIEFKGTDNLSVWVEQKQEKYIKENTQGKQRIVIEWNEQKQQQSASGQVLLVMSFTSTVLTLKDTVIPLSLWSFYNFPLSMEKIIPCNTLSDNLHRIFKQKYELVQEQFIDLNLSLFKKGFNLKDMQKMLQKMIRLEHAQKSNNSDGQMVVFAAVFTMKTLLQEIGIILQILNISSEPKLKITLSGNQYVYFQAIFQNLKFIFGK